MMPFKGARLSCFQTGQSVAGCSSPSDLQIHQLTAVSYGTFSKWRLHENNYRLYLKTRLSRTTLCCACASGRDHDPTVLFFFFFLEGILFAIEERERDEGNRRSERKLDPRGEGEREKKFMRSEHGV